MQSTLQHKAPIDCCECDTDLIGRYDWEPFIHHGEHIAICQNCIAKRYDENPDGSCLLDRARVQNTVVIHPLFPDGTTLADDTSELGYRVLSPDDMADMQELVLAGMDTEEDV